MIKRNYGSKSKEENVENFMNVKIVEMQMLFDAGVFDPILECYIKETWLNLKGIRQSDLLEAFHKAIRENSVNDILKKHLIDNE